MNHVSSKLVHESVSDDTVIVIKSEDEHVNESNGLVDKIVKVKEKDKCGLDFEGERVCRICHLSSEKSTGSSNVTINGIDLILLGCDCKADLGIAHTHCAEAWFKLKGNRFCEICGVMAKNISGGGDERFMEEWNENGSNGGSRLPERSGRCCRRQPMCNILLACLVIAFVLPWFFRVNMF
jgi:hypothetical protein